MNMQVAFINPTACVPSVMSCTSDCSSFYDSNERICIEGKLRIKYRGGYFNVSGKLLHRTRKITARRGTQSFTLY